MADNLISVADCFILPNVDKKCVKNLTNIGIDSAWKLMEPLKVFAVKHRIGVLPKTTKTMLNYYSELISVVGSKRLTNDGLIKLYGSFSSVAENYAVIAKSDDAYLKLWKNIIEDFEISSIEIENAIGRSPFVYRTYGWSYHYRFFPEAMFSPLYVVTQNWISTEKFGKPKTYYLFTLRPSYRKILAREILGSESIEPQLYKELPENDFEIENFENVMGTDLVIFGGIALTGSLLSANGSMSASGVKKIKKQYQIREFLPYVNGYSLDRIELLALTYFSLYGREGSEITIAKLAKFAVEELPSLLIGPQFNSFLPEFQGFTKIWTDDNYAPSLTSAVRDLLRPAQNEWMSLDNFRLRLMSEGMVDADSISYLKLFSATGRDKSVLKRRDGNSICSKSEDGTFWFEEVGLPFAYNWIRFLCAIGIVELAVKRDNGENTKLDFKDLRYVRLTALGRYAFGIDDEYKPSATQEYKGIEFDGISGIVTLENNKSPYRMFFATIADHISSTRFKISPGSLIKGCKFKYELENRIDNLIRLINPQTEPLLKKIIKETLIRTECGEFINGYTLINIKPNLQGLMELISSERRFRELVIPVGFSSLLIKTENIEKFKNLCSSNGYLMD